MPVKSYQKRTPSFLNSTRVLIVKTCTLLAVSIGAGAVIQHKVVIR